MGGCPRSRNIHRAQRSDIFYRTPDHKALFPHLLPHVFPAALSLVFSSPESSHLAQGYVLSFPRDVGTSSGVLAAQEMQLPNPVDAGLRLWGCALRRWARSENFKQTFKYVKLYGEKVLTRGAFSVIQTSSPNPTARKFNQCLSFKDRFV
jgi:hypothetical protein